MNHYVFNIIRDPEPRNPREECVNFGTMACWHRRYRLGDEQPEEYLRGISDAIVLPIYLYDHSDIAISTAPFSCPWDSGQVGFISVSKAKVREEFGVKRITAKVREKAEEILRGEVKDYDKYLRGEVWAFEIKELPELPELLDRLGVDELTEEDDIQEIHESFPIEGSEDFETFDSCYGFYDEEECRRQAKSALAAAEAGHAQRIAREHGQLELAV
jgi:hypothetical protein